MMRTSFFSSRSALWIVLVISSTVYAQLEWFGSNDQYKCHCTNNNCDSDGNCISGGCVPGWFGPQCQYVDLFYTENDGYTKEIFRDDDDTTCNDDATQQQATMVFKEPYPFTWLRIHVRNAGSLSGITVDFEDGSGNAYQCLNNRNATVDDNTIDIHCDLDVEIKKVFVRGTGVKDLCSVYISGGRNLALRQNPTQSSNLGGNTADKAVDGNTNQYFSSGSCSHTAQVDGTSDLNWKVSLSRNSQVNRYVLYNRDDCCEGRLQKFTLTSKDDNQAEVFSYHENGPTALLIYTVTTAIQTSPVQTVVITTSHVDHNTATNPIIALCEVEIYGDPICPVGKYGKECELDCHCASSEKCFTSTGRCPNGCDVGYMGDTCNKECPNTKYGADCKQNCNPNCLNQECNRLTGGCNSCNPGFIGNDCGQECDPGDYGINCAEHCSTHCQNPLACDKVYGNCVNCKWGYTGPRCDEACPDNKYGPHCINTCSPNCVDQKCNGATGNCNSCPAGKAGDKCDRDCQDGYYGSGCIYQCRNCADNTKCNKENGRCEDCPPGKRGPMCDQECLPTTFGARCTKKCSTNCTQQLCDKASGTCTNCPSGKTGDLCDQDCPPTRYGPRCKDQCSVDCANSKCNGVNGTCINCPSGKTGDRCQLECPATYFGPRCINMCSITCLDSKCNRSTGICDQCPKGKHGEQCDRNCPKGYYGDDCRETCSVNCKVAGDCDPENGTCFKGCGDGFTGDHCDTICDVGQYGKGCNFTCSEFCNTTGLTRNKTSCHHVNGSCLYGCDDQHEGLMCGAEKLSDTPDAPVGAIVGAIIAVVVIVALIVIGVLIWRRKHSKKDGTGIFKNRNKSPKSNEKTGFMQPGNSRVDGNPYENVEIAAGTNQVKIAAPSAKAETAKTSKPDIKPKPTAKPKKGDDPATYYNTGNLGKSKSTSIPIGQLQAFVAANSKEFFKKQFESIPDNKKATTKIAQNADNKQKNRYKNICAYDHSRVCLLADKDKSLGDYINANYIEGYNGEEKFIASQGPTKINMNDFIRMLWEQKVEKVVMLTNLVEEGKMKCEKYWPEDEKQWFGDIKMVLTTTEIFADYTIRRLNLKKEGEPVQPVIHFHFTSWPDKGVPTMPWGLVDFEQRVASYPTTKPIVVHCSAGVGRTGTFIALRNVMREAEDTGYVDCFATVQKLRHDRVNMVQTAEQYEFLHRAAQVAMVCLGTTVTSADIQDRITKLEAKTPAGQTLMEHEFAAICSVCADDGEADTKQEEAAADSTYVVYENSSLVANKLKDRLKNVPAKENYRAILARENDDMSDYINAVLVPSFRKLDQQILTQLPLPTTVTDFWRLVTQYKVALVVAFDLGCDEKDSSVADYLPLNKDETMSVPLFKITSGSISRGEISEVQQVTVDAVDVDVRRKSMPVFLNGQHHLMHVKYMSPDLNPKKLLDLIKQVREHIPGPEGRVIFMCRNGATYSGLMCVLTLLLDRMDNDLRLTVPLVVGAIKSIRPQVIPTLDQYKLLYQILHMYNESNNVYSNFGETQTPEKERRKVEEEQDKENAGIYANN